MTTNSKEKILILYTSIGMGHKYIAFNMAFHLEQAGYQVKLHDVLVLQDGIMVKVGEWFHSLVNRKFPFVWRWLYMSQGFSKVTMPLRVPLAGGNIGNIKKVIDEFQPEMVIATQTSASAPMAYMKRYKIYNGKFVIAFSDYHFHPYWFYEEADFYLVNIPEQQAELEKLGVPASKIEVCGIALKPQEPIDAQAVKQKLSSIDANLVGKQIVLMSSGSLGIGFPESLLLDFAEKLKQAEPNIQLVVVCGKNEAMKLHLQEKAHNRKLNMTTLGFYEPMAELYAVTKIFLTKPGGLTVAEALRDNVQMLATHFLPGQEELNYGYLTKHKLIAPIPQPLTSENLVKSTLAMLAQKIEVESPNSAVITQKNHEGSAIIKSIENLFQKV
jgi:processive 1,2-diacylglycerol beta-glucosyltransferase